MEGTAYTLATFLTDIGSVFTSVMGWLTTVGQAIVSNPVLLVGVAVPLIFLGVNMFRRLLNIS